MAISVCEPYVWYLVVTCKNCGVRQPIHRDPSKGEAALLRNYTWTCIQCNQVATYDANEVERYQHVMERRKRPRS